jgi:hypothetical protein
VSMTTPGGDLHRLDAAGGQAYTVLACSSFTKFESGGAR